MFRVVRLAAIGALLAYGVSAPAIAEPDTSTAAAAKKKDPNEIVCEKQEVLGSRLASKKVCMTRAEWTEQRRNDRDTVDRTQTGSCIKQAGC